MKRLERIGLTIALPIDRATGPSEFDWKHPTNNVDSRLVMESGGYTPREPVAATAEVGVGVRVAPVVPPCGQGGLCFYEGDVGDNSRRDYSYYEAAGQHPRDHDTDADGIRDAWERANGLVVGEDNHATDLDGDGYTDLEEYLAALARCSP